MDWLEDFKYKFNGIDKLMFLKRDKLHGKVTINFSDGVPHNVKVEINVQPKKEEGLTCGNQQGI